MSEYGSSGQEMVRARVAVLEEQLDRLRQEQKQDQDAANAAQVAALMSSIGGLTAELDAYRLNNVDAERFRWLQKGLHHSVKVKGATYYVPPHPEPDWAEKLAETVDAAMKEGQA